MLYLIVMADSTLVHPIGLNTELAAVAPGHVVAVFVGLLLDVHRVLLLDFLSELVHAEVESVLDVYKSFVEVSFGNSVLVSPQAAQLSLL